jgi:hypothetical protein
MNIAYAAALLMLFTTPAFSQATKTENGVLLQCEVTGSGKDGFSVTGDNKQGKVDQSCSATCTLTKADNSKLQKSYTSNVGKGMKAYIGGDASISGAPLKDPTLSNTSCKSV